MRKTAITRRRLGALVAGVGAAIALAAQAPAWAAAPPPGPQTYFLLVLSDPVAGQEDAYARWFAEPHLQDLLSVPGVVSAQHFVDAKLELRHAPTKTPQDYVLYTIVTDHPEAVRDEIAHRADAGRTWPGPTVATVRTVTYRANRPKLKGVGGEPATAKPGPKETYTVIAFGDSLPGQDDGYNTWYDTIHAPELMSNPGVVDGQRSVFSEVQLAQPFTQNRYLMSQTIVTSDLPAVFQGILHGGGPSPTMDRTHGFGYTYRAVGPALQSASK